MGEQTKELADEIANLEGSLTIAFDGEEVGYRQSSVVLANEPDADAPSTAIRGAARGDPRELNPRYRRELAGPARSGARPGLLRLRGALLRSARSRLQALRAVTDSFLQETEGVYQRSLDRLLAATMGSSLDQVHYC